MTEQGELLLQALKAARCYSGLQADGSTDVGNMENELFLALDFDL